VVQERITKKKKKKKGIFQEVSIRKIEEGILEFKTEGKA